MENRAPIGLFYGSSTCYTEIAGEKIRQYIGNQQVDYFNIADTPIIENADLVAVGRFDRYNLFASTKHRDFELFDNARLGAIRSDSFSHTPVDVAGSADGRFAYVAFGDAPRLAIFDLEQQQIEYLEASVNGIGAMSLGLSNNVCH